MINILALILILITAQNVSADNPSILNLFRPGNTLSLIVVNVNSGTMQGDAILIAENGGRTILIDSGERHEAEKSLLPLLRQLKISYLDSVLITHSHFDHYGGLIPLLTAEDMTIGRIHLGNVTAAKCAYEYWGCNLGELQQIKDLSEDRNVPIADYSKWNGLKFRNGAVLEKLFQFDEHTTPLTQGTDINDLSLVIMLTYADTSILLPGDLNHDLSEWAVNKMRMRVKAEILKVPHHGTESLASNNFLEATKAKYFLVPGPKDLWCSERSRRIRELADKMQAKVFVNGIHGHIFVRFFESSFEITSELKTEGKLCE